VIDPPDVYRWSNHGICSAKGGCELPRQLLQGDIGAAVGLSSQSLPSLDQ
jgi:hypothetical protein